MAISNAGGLMEALFPAKYVKHYYSDALQKNIDDQAGVLTARQGDNTSDLRRFSQGTRTAVADLDALKPQDIAAYGNIINNLSMSNPLATRQALSDMAYADFDRYAKRVGDATTLSDNLRSQKLGFGGRPGGSYSQTLIADRTSRNLAPVLGSLMANLGIDTSRIGSDRRSDYSQADQMIGARADVPVRSLRLMTAPIDARNATTAGELQNMLMAIQGAIANLQAVEKRDQKIVGVSKAADSTVNGVVDLATSLLPLVAGGMTGGAGGLLGGLLGGGGGGKAAPQTASSAIPSFRVPQYSGMYGFPQQQYLPQQYSQYPQGSLITPMLGGLPSYALPQNQ